MGTNPLAPPPDAALRDVQSAGRSALSQAINPSQPAPPPPAIPEAPPPEPVAVPTPPVEAEPPAPQPEPGVPPPAEDAAPAANLDPASFTEEALRALRMEGWSDGQPITQTLVNKLSERYLEFNNRLGKRGDVVPPDATPPEPEPAPAQPVEEEPPPPIALSQEQIDQHVREAVQQDQEAQGWITDWRGNNAAITEMNGQIDTIARSVALNEMRLELPEIANDTTGISASEIREEIRELKGQLRELKADRRDKQIENQDLNSQYIEREDHYKGYVRSEVQTQARIDAFQAQASVEWGAALARVADRHKLTAEDREELSDRARDAGIAILDRGRGQIPNLERHIETYAQRIKASQDRHHRQLSAEYAATKLAGTQPAVPAQAAAPETAPAQAPTQGGLEAVYAKARGSLRQEVG